MRNGCGSRGKDSMLQSNVMMKFMQNILKSGQSGLISISGSHGVHMCWDAANHRCLPPVTGKSGICAPGYSQESGRGDIPNWRQLSRISVRVLQDFQETFRRHSKEVGLEGEILWTEKFYQIDRWDPPLYEKLGREFDFHVALVEDLMLELTRATNYICDRVRQFISPAFRLREGLVLAQSGPYMDLTFRMHRLEYRRNERILHPYPRLEQFKKDRKNRDFHFGEGINADDPEFRVGGDE